MRIVGGTHRHRLIKLPVVRETRATKDAVREAVFSALGPIVGGALVLDLFAGSGAFGLEALSRGAKRSIMADHNDICIATIKENLATLGLPGGEAWLLPYHQTLARLEKDIIRCDIVFLDPPYHDKLCEPIIADMLARNLIADHGVFVAETQKELLIDETKFMKVRRYRYGITRVAILWR